jgi:hypothetical protein
MTLTAAVGFAAYWLLVRPWYLRWGATDDELLEALPGDEAVPQPKTHSTRAVTIDAPVTDVWPWLVQLGQTRAGFYSYSWLENMTGCDMKNADRVVPEWQHIAVGDKVWLHPRVSLRVAAVDPGRSLVLERDWSFNVRPIDERTTRLIVRGRGVYEFPDLKLPPLNFVYWRMIFEPAHFIMERGMMLGIKPRAERLAAERRAHEGAAVGVG